ncbi:leucine rich repeat [Seminavis robusta]|uniref:Leucine rich repeat n=1 Tax=Seminavis robusta TaxID=568900 RepID=A0A9N8DW20_9STRA|nr:leucine rich repeat [Seminavis robusta]|eukprot:Sro416_g138620.1 leucine rich repeat (1156) ;mRNA; r:31939-35562
MNDSNDSTQRIACSEDACNQHPSIRASVGTRPSAGYILALTEPSSEFGVSEHVAEEINRTEDQLRLQERSHAVSGMAEAQEARVHTPFEPRYPAVTHSSARNQKLKQACARRKSLGNSTTPSRGDRLLRASTGSGDLIEEVLRERDRMAREWGEEHPDEGNSSSCQQEQEQPNQPVIGAVSVPGIGVESAHDEAQDFHEMHHDEEDNCPNLLIEATLVEEASTEFATSAPSLSDIESGNLPTLAEAKALDDKEMATSCLRSKTGKLIIALVLLTMTVMVVVLTVGMSMRRETTGSTSSFPSIAPTSSYVQKLARDLNLTDATMSTISQDLESPQAQALKWLIQDPNYPSLSLLQKTQRFPLAVLYYSTQGQNWTNSTNFLDYQSRECSWHLSAGPGTCYDGIISTIYWDGNNLNGTIPQEIAVLKDSLSVLSLSANNLKGAIPSELGLMSSIFRLSAKDCQLSNTLPTELGGLFSLVMLDFRNNSLSGTIPRELAALDTIHSVELSANALTGSVPAEMIRQPSRFHVDLSNNQLSGSIPTEFNTTNRLEALLLGSNNIQGTIPSEIGFATSMGRLDLSFNEISGQIPSEIQALTGLSSLLVGSNMISGELPTSLGLMHELCELDFKNNRLQGTMPPSLTGLCFGEQSITPSENATHTTVLGVAVLEAELLNEIIGLLERIGKEASSILTKFDGLEDVVVGVLQQRYELDDSYIWLDLKFAIQFSIGHLPSKAMLTNALFGSPGIFFDYEFDSTKRAPIGVFQANVQPFQFDISNNAISGSLPPSLFANIPMIHHFNAGSNSLTGIIPTEVGAASTMTMLSLAHNKIEGSIPSELGQLGALTMLDLSHNMLSNQIPQECRNLRSLQSLNLGSNRVVGTLDAVFQGRYINETNAMPRARVHGSTAGAALCHIDVSNNSLSGTLPTEVGSLCLRDVYTGDTTLTMALRIEYDFWHWIVPGMPDEDVIETLQNQTSQFLGNLFGRNFPDLQSVHLRYLDGSFGSNETHTSLSLDFLVAVTTDDSPMSIQDLVRVLGDEGAVQDYIRYYINSYDLLGSRFDGITSVAFLVDETVDPLATLPPVTLDVSFNNLSGKIPSELAYLSTLDSHVNLLGNMFSGVLPIQLCPWHCDSRHKNASESSGNLMVDCQQVVCDCNCSDF